jgi:hypothetical protein
MLKLKKFLRIPEPGKEANLVKDLVILFENNKGTMKITYPHTIENGLGEKIIFHSVQKEPDGDRVIVENFVTPGHGPYNAYTFSAG